MRRARAHTHTHAPGVYALMLCAIYPIDRTVLVYWHALTRTDTHWHAHFDIAAPPLNSVTPTYIPTQPLHTDTSLVYIDAPCMPSTRHHYIPVHPLSTFILTCPSTYMRHTPINTYTLPYIPRRHFKCRYAPLHTETPLNIPTCFFID